MDILVRQAHPGSGDPAYQSFEQKMQDAQRYQREEKIPWPILVDDLQGTTHQVYGGLPAPVYLIDVDGRIAFYNMSAYGPTLHRAIEALMAQNGRGVVLGGWSRSMSLGPAITDGWRGIARGLPESAEDLSQAAPGSSKLLQLGYQARPLLAPLTLRAEPLPMPIKAAMIAVGLAGVFLGTRFLSRRMMRS